MSNEEKPELYLGEDNLFYWNFRMGNRYWLGYHHGRVAGTALTDQESVHGFFFGNKEGRPIFFREKDGEVHKYVGGLSRRASCMGGDDEQGEIFVDSTYMGKVPEGAEKKFILEKLAKNNVRIESQKSKTPSQS